MISPARKAPSGPHNHAQNATLAKVLKRPAFMAVPTPALHALFGREMTKEMLLGGQKVLPERLQESGYTFAYPGLEDALRHTLQR